MLSNKVSEIMTTELIAAEAKSTISAVMELMVEKDVGRVMITETGGPVGIVTEKDILRKVVNKKYDPKKTSVRRIMTSPIRAVQQDSLIVDALGRMYKGKFRHLLVRGDRRAIVGIVSMRRILELAVRLGEGLPESQTVGSIMSGKLVTAEPADTVYNAIEKMIKEETGCVIVASGGRPMGIFTERDVLKRVAVKSADTRKAPVEKVMSKNLVTAERSALIGEVLAKMHQGDFRNMPILDESGELVGLVSMPDVLQYARALNIDETVRRTWKEIAEFWESEDQYTPG